MLPLRCCLQAIEHAPADATLAPRILDALIVLEASYPRSSERIVALEAILHAFARSPSAGNAHLSRLLRVVVDGRQSAWARRLEIRPDVATRASGLASAAQA